MKAYNDMVRRDNVLKERLFAAEAYEVYVERSRVYRFHVFLVDAGGVWDSSHYCQGFVP